MALTPEQIAAPHTERAEQMSLFAWAALNVGKYPELKWMYAIKNQEKGGAIRGANFKAEGVKAGVSDVCLPCARKGFHGIYIEMKKEDGKESKEQKEFGDFLIKEGYYYTVCYNWHQAANLVSGYLSQEN